MIRKLGSRSGCRLSFHSAAVKRGSGVVGQGKLRVLLGKLRVLLDDFYKMYFLQ